MAALRRLPYPNVLLIAAAAIAAALLACAVARTLLWTYGADTGTFAIAIWNVPHAMYDPFENGSHFRYHFSPILALLYPLLALTRSILVLQAVQVVLVVATVFPYYALVEPHLGRALALRCALIALFYPPLIGLAFSEFHELAFAPLLTMLVLLFAQNRRWVAYGLCALMLICVREDVALIAAIFAVIAAIVSFKSGDRERVIAFAATAAVAAFAVSFYFLALIPRLGGWPPHSFYAYPFQQGLAAVAQQLFTFPRFTYFLESVVPLALLPLLTRWFALAVPGLVIVLAANSGIVYRMGMHYVALWLPWMLVAAAASVGFLQNRYGETIARRWANTALALCVAFLIFFDPAHPLHYLTPRYHDLAAVARVIGCAPQGALLATHDEWYAGLALTHPNVTIGMSKDAKYYLFADDYANGVFETTQLPALRRDIANGSLVEICRDHHVAVYRRTGK